jgi:hypothetical protein
VARAQERERSVRESEREWERDWRVRGREREREEEMDKDKITWDDFLNIYRRDTTWHVWNLAWRV